MTGPRASKIVKGMEVNTINSYHARPPVPEVAYLIKVDGLVIYFSGDYRGDYENDMVYLKSKVNRADIALMNIDHDSDSLRLEEAEFLEMLRPRVVFPMHYGNEEYILKRNAAKVKKAGHSKQLICVEKRGDRFFYSAGMMLKK